MSARLVPGPARHRPRPAAARTAFSLVELLTVVGIIALLIAILLPSLSGARTEAQRTATKAVLGSLDRGLEGFNTDFGKYPDSKRRADPVTKWSDPAINDGEMLSGAHWLARAMVGHDYDFNYGADVPPTAKGLDYGGRTLEAAPMEFSNFKLSPPKGPFAQRRSAYVQDKIGYARDSEPRLSATAPTGRGVLLDTFNFPILYYRATPRAQRSFNETYSQAAANGPSIYYQEDNAELTGGRVEGNTSVPGWKFGEGVKQHGMGVFGDLANPGQKASLISSNATGLTFIGTLYDSRTKGAIRPTGFVLVSAGPDGTYGTPDDVTNFK